MSSPLCQTRSLETHFRLRPSYQSKGWTRSIHSEGKRYAHNRTETGLSVVTEAKVSDSVVTERLNHCIGSIRALASEKDIPLPETSDLFLEINDDANTCNYWFADHAHRTVFWLHPVDPTAVGLPHAFSKSHFRESFYSSPHKNLLKFATRIRPGGELLGPCGDVPRDGIAICRHSP